MLVKGISVKIQNIIENLRMHFTLKLDRMNTESERESLMNVFFFESVIQIVRSKFNSDVQSYLLFDYLIAQLSTFNSSTTLIRYIT